MRKVIGCSALSTLLLAASQALPCGGGFGYGVNIEPTQKIIVSHHDGVETYVFNPYFCQKAESFGLILPVPAVLTQNPALSQQRLYDDLATIAAPTIQNQTVCASGGSAGTGGSRAASVGGASNSATVIQKGQVGIFDWALLQAQSSASFTDWLTANGFPFQSSATAIFEQYVKESWYFIAFKVSVGSNATGVGGNGAVGTQTSTISSGQTLCGNFGPISLAFPRDADPVVPARIAAVSSSQLTWTLYTLASERLKIRDQSALLRFAGPISSDAMTQYPTLAGVAQAGDRLTELQATLNPATASDLILEPDSDQTDYRRTEIKYVTVTCGTGGRTGTGGASYTGGTRPIGGNSSIGGVPLTAGGPGMGGAPVTGGSKSTAGSGGNGFAMMTGGRPSDVGSTSTGGVAISDTGTGGAYLVSTSTGVTNSTGGTPAVSSSSAAVTEPKDEGGCSMTGPTSGRNRLGVILLATMGLLVRRRRKARQAS